MQIDVAWAALMPHNQSNSSYNDDPLSAAKRNDWIKKLRTDLRPYGKGAYIAYPDETLDDPVSEYFGDNVNRLMQIKRKYDPNNRFCHSQSLMPCKFPKAVPGILSKFWEIATLVQDLVHYSIFSVALPIKTILNYFWQD